MMEGKGTFVWPDGTHYDGAFKANVISGDGVFEW
jgi:hypothetical protein